MASVPLADTAGVRFLQRIHADPNRTPVENDGQSGKLA